MQRVSIYKLTCFSAILLGFFAISAKNAVARSGELESVISVQLQLQEQDSALKWIREFAIERGDVNETYYYLLEAHLLLSSEGKMQYDSCLFYCELITKNTNETSALNFEARLNRVRVYRAKGDYLQCMEEIQELQSNEAAPLRGRRVFLVDVELFKLYLQIGDLESAQGLVSKLLEQYEQQIEKDRYEGAMALGNYYLELDSLSEAKKYFENAFNLAQIGNPRDRVDAWHMLAEVDKSSRNYDAALEKYEAILRYEDSVGYRHGFIHTLLIATETTLMAGKDPTEIAAYANQAYQYASKLNNKLRLVQAEIAMGYFFNLVAQPDSATRYLQHAVVLANTIEAHYWERSGAGMLVEIHKSLGNFEDALKYQKIQSEAAAKLRTQSQLEVSEMVTNVRRVYQYRHDKELSELELERQRVYLMVWIAVSVGALGIALLLLLMYRRQKKQNRFLTQKALQEAGKKQQPAEEKEAQESQKSTLDDAVHAELKQHLEQFVTERGFRDPECSLPTLAKQFNTNTAYLSKFINEEEQVSFNQWINSHRVIDFIERIKNDPEVTATYTLEYLAGESGFKSKSTFIRAFKKHTGITPSVFLKNI